MWIAIGIASDQRDSSRKLIAREEDNPSDCYIDSLCSIAVYVWLRENLILRIYSHDEWIESEEREVTAEIETCEINWNGLKLASSLENENR